MSTTPAKPAPSPAALITPVLIGGSLILMLSFAVRASFGVFQIPIASEFDWPRAEFSLAIAIQNLAWGIGQPLFAAIGERFGDRRAIILGALTYAVGLLLSAMSVTPEGHQVWNVLIGFGVAGTGFGVILGIVGRAASDEHRSMTLGIATAAGSAGQVIGPPAAGYLLEFMAWPGVFLVFAAVVVGSLLLLPMLRAPEKTTRRELEESMGTVVGRALRDRSYLLIFLGFFSCGYQLAFVTAHFPAFVTEMCSAIDPGGTLAQMGITNTSQLGAWAIGLIGLANIGGTLLAGKLGNYFPKKYLLVAIYTGRTVVAAWFILVPMTPTTVILFSLVMGSLWLATVPLTSGLVAHIYGLRYMGTLYGIVFFSHQLGSFIGVWLGGHFYDLYHSYELVWWVGVGVGAFSAIVHLPVQERPRQLAPA
ncbi:MFS transporter [Aquibaculum arenosum]|uniref:MFS transporter n=1 Tax=Aquibaculum arenosum TaxID=3032591 RepID=A0ABT5YR13_9PROT|nr:MFS transporter [Fodinicurvata sp. CAU 1616]MDF2097180.1 MFS transporter [Fodinicurvata sp. CAU 1616]